jgi:hypothetical protein
MNSAFLASINDAKYISQYYLLVIKVMKKMETKWIELKEQELIDIMAGRELFHRVKSDLLIGIRQLPVMEEKD